MSVSEVGSQCLRFSVVGPRRVDEALKQLGASAKPGPAQPSLPRRLALWRMAHQRLARVRPAVGMGLLLVVFVQVVPETLLELPQRLEGATPQELPRQDAEEQLHLVQPRAVPGHVVKHVPLSWRAQERLPLRHRLEFLRLERYPVEV